METGSGTPSLRRAIAVLKDSTKVGLAKVNNENKGIDIAIVKATNHDEAVPKEKHVQTIFNALTSSSPRADFAYCIHRLMKRLAKTRNWTVALKILIVVHRALREVGPTFREVLIKYSQGRGLMLNMSHFMDDSSPNAWDYSAWLHTYSLYLEERLECCRVLRFDVDKEYSRIKNFTISDLLCKLPALQELLSRLLACKPQGAAVYNNVIHYALSMVASESVNLYIAITNGILKLVDKYFEMQLPDAVKALEIYKRGGTQGEQLSEFFELCRSLNFVGSQKFVKIERPPAKFIAAMEDYLQEAPQVLQLTMGEQHVVKALPAPESVQQLMDDDKDSNAQEDTQLSEMKQDSSTRNQTEEETTATVHVPDLLDFSDISPKTPQPDNQTSGDGVDSSAETSWELALVPASSSTEAADGERKLANLLDILTLNRLYDEAIAKTNQNGTSPKGQVAPNPFQSGYYGQDTFYASSNIAPAAGGQMPTLHGQQGFQTIPQFHIQQPLSQHGNDHPMPPMMGNEQAYLYYQQFQQPHMMQPQLQLQPHMMQPQTQPSFLTNHAMQMPTLPTNGGEQGFLTIQQSLQQQEAGHLQQQPHPPPIGSDPSRPVGNPFLY